MEQYDIWSRRIMSMGRCRTRLHNPLSRYAGDNFYGAEHFRIGNPAITNVSVKWNHFGGAHYHGEFKKAMNGLTYQYVQYIIRIEHIHTKLKAA
jgi:hypothetical protein